MKPNEIFKMVSNLDYRRNTADFDWAVKVDDEEKIIWVAVQASMTWLDWVINLLFFWIPQVRQWFVYFACLGWQGAFNSCKAIILNKVLKEMNAHPDYEVHCAGHSYGGVGSVLMGIEIFFASGEKTVLDTFGAPKPLFGLLSHLVCKLFFKEVRQWAHWSDLITYMPPLPGYWNVKVIRLGEFSLKGLFNPEKYHQIYDDEKLYEGKI